MKELTGSARTVVDAPIEKCFGLVEDVEGYPRWHPEVVRKVEVVERDGEGQPVRARTTLHVARGPLVKDFKLLMQVAGVRPRSLTLKRIRHDPSDQEEFEVRWSLQEAVSGTQISLEVAANLSVPRLVPVGGIGDAMAEGFAEAAARALR